MLFKIKATRYISDVFHTTFIDYNQAVSYYEFHLCLWEQHYQTDLLNPC